MTNTAKGLYTDDQEQRMKQTFEIDRPLGKDRVDMAVFFQRRAFQHKLSKLVFHLWH